MDTMTSNIDDEKKAMILSESITNMEISDDMLQICAMLEDTQIQLKVKTEQNISLKQQLKDTIQRYHDMKNRLEEREKYIIDMEDTLFELDGQLQYAEKALKDRDHIIDSLASAIELEQSLLDSKSDNSNNGNHNNNQQQHQRIIESLEMESKRLKLKVSEQNKTLEEYEELLHQQQTDVIDLTAKLRHLDHYRLKQEALSSLSPETDNKIDSSSNNSNSSHDNIDKKRKDSSSQGEKSFTPKSIQTTQIPVRPSYRPTESTIYTSSRGEDIPLEYKHYDHDDNGNDTGFDSDAMDSPGKPIRITTPTGSTSRRASAYRWATYRNQQHQQQQQQQQQPGSSKEKIFHRPRDILVGYNDDKDEIEDVKSSTASTTTAPSQENDYGIKQDLTNSSHNHQQERIPIGLNPYFRTNPLFRRTSIDGTTTPPSSSNGTTIEEGSMGSTGSRIGISGGRLYGSGNGNGNGRSPIGMNRSRRVIVPMVTPDTIDFDVS